MSDKRRTPGQDEPSNAAGTPSASRSFADQPGLSGLFARKGEATPTGGVGEVRSRRPARPTERSGGPSSLTADLICVRRGPLSDADARNPILTRPALPVGPPPNPG